MSQSEAWKYTQLNEADFRDYALVAEEPTAVAETIDWSQLYRHFYGNLIPPESPVWVFENGMLVAQSDAMPVAVQLTAGVSPDAVVRQKTPDWLLACSEAALDQRGGKWDWQITASMDAPLIVLHFYTSSKPKQAVFTRHTFTVMPGVRASLVEIVGDLHPSDFSGLCYAQNTVLLGSDAGLKHQRLSLATAGMTVLSDLNVQLAENGAYDLHTVISGGKQHRSNIGLSLTGVSAKGAIHCLHWAKHQEQMDTALDIQHLADEGESEVVIRGVADNRSTSSVTGTIHVPPLISVRRAQLENKNILLSKEATINSRPQLMIEHDNIRHCSHGATMGCLPPEDLFYLRSRGLPMQEAKQMLLNGFIDPILSGFVPVFGEALRTQLYA